MAKAERAITSAAALHQMGDSDGACNRAYYAMFDAARAALIATSAPVTPESIKTHSGLITAFSLHLVKTGKVALAHGRAINKIEDLRLIADYKDEALSLEDAQWAIQQAREFIAAIQKLLD